MLVTIKLPAFFVASLGLEPRQTEPESVVLPLHNEAVRVENIGLEPTTL